MIFDPRWVNGFLFRPPPHTAMPSPTSLAAVEIPSGEQCFLETGDVDCCFYQYVLPSYLRGCFTLPKIQKRYLCTKLKAVFKLAGETDYVKLWVRVCPMGWSWALRFIQIEQQHLLMQTVPRGPWIVDKHAGIRLLPGGRSDSSSLAVENGPNGSSLGMGLYVDNYFALSCCSRLSRRCVESQFSVLAEAGVVSEIDEAENKELIGFVLNHAGTTWLPKAAKLSKLRAATLYAWITNDPISGHEIERLLGHLVHTFSMRTELLSCVESCYTFIQSSYHKKQPLWPSCRKELRWCYSLMPLAEASMAAAWSTKVRMYDASPSGYGVVSSEFDASLVSSVGRVKERHRFAKHFAAARTADGFREEALLQKFCDLGDESHIAAGAGHFPEVLAEVIQAEWRHVYSGAWRHRTKNFHQSKREVTARSWLIRHLARDVSSFGKRRLALGDNMGVVCSAEKR